jgi:ABC-type uncharacterized transport system involved in gliding motility auxiliary subunit
MAINQNNQPAGATHLQLLFRAIGIVGLLCILGGFGYAVNKASFNLGSYIVIGIGVLLFLTLFIKAEVANLRYYLHVFVYSAMVGGICVVGYLFARQYTAQKDLTKQGLYSLSEGSSKYLKGLDKEVTITALLSSAETAAPQIRDVQNLYKTATDKVKWVFLDPRKDRIEAMKLGDSPRAGDVYIGSGQNKKKMNITEIIGANSESSITNAIIDVTRDVKPKLYFLTGHGEVAFEAPVQMRRQQQEEAPTPTLAAFRKFLTDRGMETLKLDISKTSAVPKDASMLVIAGPENDLLPPEVAAIDEYLKAGGKAMVLLDVPQRNFSAALTNLSGLLTKYGVNTPDKVVIDLEAAMLTGKPVLPLVSWFNPEQPITKTLDGSRILLSLTRPLEAAAQPPQGLTTTELIKTGDKAFSADLASVVANSKIAPPPQSEWKAQVVGMAVSKPAPPTMPNMPRQPKDDSAGGTRLVVFGTSALIQDELLSNQQPAVHVMLNTVNWLTEQADKIDVAPRQIEGTPIILTDAQKRIIFAFSVLLLPAGLFFGGMSYSMMRRKR